MENGALLKAVVGTIKKLRKAKKISQERLALDSGLDRTYVSGVERGGRNITINSLEKIIIGLGVNQLVFLEHLHSDLRPAKKLK